ncbi:ABC transporter permease [Sharpea azabuensis]|uniref:ABC transporter permease n=1 Tax=Sharpea azabuensis TaxID=322505 RepID=UPI0008F3FA69|nr:ABC transporter permease [Sharpea azabuensis]SFD56831.1 ABC-2 type transport system permease protein [Sharpea azabuensis]SFK56758.1 ABC-2 type transport system permease protein [Sharpea azabuensis]
MFKSIYQYRELLKTNVKKDIRGKYKASVLGVLWSFINPLLQVAVYAIVFPYILGASQQNYIVYLVTGIIPWTFFQMAVIQGTTTIKGNAGIIKKVYFPREILPLSVVLSGLINFFISCIIILGFCIFFGVGISWHIIFVPFIALIEAVLALGLGLALGAINAYVQDTEYIVNFLLTMAFYGSPIVYQLSQFSNAGLLAKIINLNPMTKIINAYREVFLYHHVPGILGLFIVFLFALVVLVIGYAIFRKLEKGFAEEL